jgi:hypothetical protein
MGVPFHNAPAVTPRFPPREARVRSEVIRSQKTGPFRVRVFCGTFPWLGIGPAGRHLANDRLGVQSKCLSRRASKLEGYV